MSLFLSLCLSLFLSFSRSLSLSLCLSVSPCFSFCLSFSLYLPDVFTDSEFSAPGNSFLWGLGALEESNRERTGFLIMPKRPYEWRVDSHGCCMFDNAGFGFGPRDQTAHFSCLPSSRHQPSENLTDSIMRSDQTHDRKRLRKQLAQQSASSTVTTQTQPSAAPM